MLLSNVARRNAAAAGGTSLTPHGSLQVVSMSEELRRALYSSGSLTSLDLEMFLPEIVGESEIVDDQVRKVRGDGQKEF